MAGSPDDSMLCTGGVGGGVRGTFFVPLSSSAAIAACAAAAAAAWEAVRVFDGPNSEETLLGADLQLRDWAILVSLWVPPGAAPFAPDPVFSKEALWLALVSALNWPARSDAESVPETSMRSMFSSTSSEPEAPLSSSSMSSESESLSSSPSSSSLSSSTKIWASLLLTEVTSESVKIEKDGSSSFRSQLVPCSSITKIKNRMSSKQS